MRRVQHCLLTFRLNQPNSLLVLLALKEPNSLLVWLIKPKGEKSSLLVLLALTNDAGCDVPQKRCGRWFVSSRDTS